MEKSRIAKTCILSFRKYFLMLDLLNGKIIRLEDKKNKK